jgi:hypothetical protein
MIKANELRIDNWVMIVSGQMLQIEFIDPEDEALESFYPIPLTPEILERCGFIKNSLGAFDTYDFGKISIRLPGLSYNKGRTYFNSWCIIEGVPKSLHRLQNIVHSLTGQELNYNPHGK